MVQLQEQGRWASPQPKHPCQKQFVYPAAFRVLTKRMSSAERLFLCEH